MSAPLLAAVMAALLSAGILRLILTSRIARHVLDHANDRSMHVGAIPRIGGLGIALSVLLTLGIVNTLLKPEWPRSLEGLSIPVIAIFCISALDDLRSLGARLRLLVHLICACALVFILPIPMVWSLPVIVAAAWGANLYNFMDGSDGLAGTMASVGFGALALGSQWAGQLTLALICATISGASIGFLLLNKPAAKLFMGDAGSVTLGFAAAALSLLGVIDKAWSVAFTLTVFMPFIFDASLTLIRRILNRAPLAQAHREHLYQRVVLSGIGHKGVWRGASLLMLASAVPALLGLRYFPEFQLAILILVAAIHCGVWIVIEARLRKQIRD